MTDENTLHNPTGEDLAVRNQMEKMVDTYDDYMRKVTRGREQALRDATVDLAQLKPGDSVLEIGCATGTLSLAAQQRVGVTGRVCGIDVIPGMVEVSRRKAAQAGVSAEFREGSIDAIPYTDGQFDAVLCSFMIFHMSEPVRRRGIAEIHRVLKPGGRLVALDFAVPERPLQRLFVTLFFKGLAEHDLGELLPLMEASGFEGLERAPFTFRVMGLQVLGFARGRARKA
jgi:ubiquinone/menaquinone biosynthesis C-methylase UbiE